MPDTTSRNAMREAFIASLSGSGRPGIWVSGLACVLALAGVGEVRALQSAGAGQRSAPQQRWYDAYDRGIAAVKERNWRVAEPLLIEAREGGPAQSARAYFFGDTYRPFVPDYYLGIVYLNTNRPEQADKSFGAASVVAGREREFANLATLRAEAAKLVEAKTAPVEPAVKTPDPVANPPATGGGAAPPPATPPPYLPPATSPIQQLPNVTTPSTRPVTPPSTGVPPRAPRNAGNLGGATKSPYTPGPVGGIPATSAKDTFARWREGLRAFLIGDYNQAVAILEPVAAQPSAPPQARIYLACARVGAVLSGRGDAALLAIAKQEFQAVDGANTLGAEDRRYISPRILAQLQTRCGAS